MKKLKINTSLEQMDEWTYESYVSDYIFENVCIEQNLDNVTIDGCKFSKCQFKDCSFSFMECMDIIFDHCEFENVHFNQCSLSRVHFISCRISGMEFSQSLMQDTLFQLCKGHYCDFGGSTFKDCMFDINDLTNYDYRCIYDFYKKKIETKTTIDSQLDFLLQMYCHGSIEMTKSWVEKNMYLDIETLVNMLIESMPERLKQYINL